MDQDFVEMHPSGFYIADHIYFELMTTLESDCHTMQNLQLTDYSLLLGVEYLRHVVTHDPNRR